MFSLADFEEIEQLTGIDVLDPDMAAVSVSDRMAAMEFMARRKAGQPLTMEEVRHLPIDDFLVAGMGAGLPGLPGAAAPKAQARPRPKQSRKR